jgi:hypothetical protein
MAISGADKQEPGFEIACPNYLRCYLGGAAGCLVPRYQQLAHLAEDWNVLLSVIGPVSQPLQHTITKISTV